MDRYEEAMIRMVRAIMDTSSWVHRAKCKDHEEDFVQSVGKESRIKDIELIRICNGKDGEPECPVKLECLEHALSTKERVGVYGGMTTEQRDRRRRVIAKRRRQSGYQVRVSGNRVIVRGKAVI